MAEVVLEGVTKRYPGSSLGVDDLNIRIADREFLVLVGPSGCGKSTTLRLIAGLETCSEGRIYIGGREVSGVAPSQRDIAMVFQNYALYPHMTVYRNLAFGLRLRYGGGIGARLLRRLINPRRAAEFSVLRRGIDQRVRQAAERLGISELLDRKPHELSGGERQRVALGRAIVRNPAAFLFDEPLSNLDAKLRQQMRGELKQLHQTLAATTLYVTHDQIEAMTLGQRVAVMNRGRLQQLDSPVAIYQRPANLFVARFFGSTPINLLPGELRAENGTLQFVSSPGTWDLGPVWTAQARTWPRQVLLAFRGEDLEWVDEGDIDRTAGARVGPGGEWFLPAATVRQLDHWGEALVLSCGGSPGPEWVAKLPASPSDLEKPEWQRPESDLPGSDLPTSATRRIRRTLRLGDQVSFRIHPARCLWFDPVSELNLVRTNT